MKKYSFLLLLIIPLFFCSCSDFERFESSGEDEDITSPISGSEDEELEALEIESISFNFVSPIVITQGEVKHARLNVQLSDSSVYKNVSSFFDGPGDDLDNTVVWSSNNDSVISANSDGEITALEPGATSVLATIGSVTGILGIVVKEPPVNLKHIDFHDDSLEFSDRDSVAVTLDAEFLDGSSQSDLTVEALSELVDCDLTFTSYDPQIVVIDQAGVITPVSEGETLVTVKCGSKANSMPVTVSQLTPVGETPEELIRSIRITVDDSNWVVGDFRSLRCEVKFNTGTVSSISEVFITPNGNVTSVSWQSLDESIISIDGGDAQLIDYGETYLFVFFEDFADSELVKVKMLTEDPDWSGDSFLSSNDDYLIEYGDNGGFNSHLFPDIVYGLPQNGGVDVVSFGGGGYMWIGLNDYFIVDGPGVDFTLFENAVISNLEGHFAERAQVYVSVDDFVYFPFDCDHDDPNEVYAGCAGVNPVNAEENPLDSSVSGGDSFDMADVELPAAKYILIVDMNTCALDDPTYFNLDGDLLCSLTGTQGFDLDALAIINGLNE